MKLDEQFLQETGLGDMPADEKAKFLDYLNDALVTRIGERIAEKLSPEQLAEFDQISDQTAASRWLGENCPDYHEIITRTISELKDEIRTSRDQLL